MAVVDVRAYGHAGALARGRGVDVDGHERRQVLPPGGSTMDEADEIPEGLVRSQGFPRRR